jgi:predicted transcriptional regulator
LAAIQEGLDDIEAGRTEEHEDVINEVLAELYKLHTAKS